MDFIRCPISVLDISHIFHVPYIYIYMYIYIHTYIPYISHLFLINFPDHHTGPISNSHRIPIKFPSVTSILGPQPVSCRRISPKLPAEPRSFCASGVSSGRLCSARADFLQLFTRVTRPETLGDGVGDLGWCYMVEDAKIEKLEDFLDCFL